MADTIPLPSDADHTGRGFGYDELALLGEVLHSGTLDCTRGTQVKAFEREFAERYGVSHARAVWNEFSTNEHVDFIAGAVRAAVTGLRQRASA